MFGATLKATNSSFQKGMTFCPSIYVKRVMKLLAFIFEQPSYFNWCEIVFFFSLVRLISHLIRGSIIFKQYLKICNV